MPSESLGMKGSRMWAHGQMKNGEAQNIAMV